MLLNMMISLSQTYQRDANEGIRPINYKEIKCQLLGESVPFLGIYILSKLFIFLF